MKKLTLIFIFLFSFVIDYSQQAILLFKKKDRNLESFWVGSTIAFQTSDKQWQKGEITRIQNDSFFIRPSVVRYNLLNTDNSLNLATQVLPNTETVFTETGWTKPRRLQIQLGVQF